MKPNYILLLLALSLFSCSSGMKNYQKELHQNTDKFAEIDLPINIDKSNIDNFYLYKIDDVEFIEKFIDTAYTPQVEYSSVFKHSFTEEIDVLIWLKKTDTEKVLQLATYKLGNLISIINIAGKDITYNYSCEISEKFDINVIADNINKTLIYFYAIRQDGEIVVLEKLAENKLHDITSFFNSQTLPYITTGKILNINFQQLDDDEIEYFFGNSNATSAINTSNYTYYPFSYLDLKDDLCAYTFFVAPDDPHANDTKEQIFISKNNIIVAYFDLYYSDVGITTNSKVLKNNDKIFIQYDIYEYDFINYKDVLVNFSIAIYELSASATQLIAAKLYDAYNTSSFDYLYNISKIKGEVPVNSFEQYCKVFEEQELWKENYDYDNIKIKSISYFPLKDTMSGFIYYITDRVQNTFVFNKLSSNGKLLEYEIIEDCSSWNCENFNYSEMFFGNRKFLSINSTHAAGKFPINTYCTMQDFDLLCFTASGENYQNYKNTNFYKYIFSLISDEEHEQMKLTKDISAIVTDLQEVTPTNDILEMNLNKLMNY